MDKERLEGLISYYKVLNESTNYDRLIDVTVEIEKELGINQPVCGGFSDFGVSDEVCEPPSEN